MSHFTTFALAGLGNVGTFIAEELLKRKAAGKAKRVVILTRSSGDDEKYEPYKRNGAEVLTVDYSSKDSLTAALSGIEVVVSTIALGVSDAQSSLAVAAKEAGVKLFVPSEFGSPTDSLSSGPLSPKHKMREQLKTLDLPYALIYNGAFTDRIFSARLGIDPVGGKATLGGDGSALVSFTTRSDVARYVAWILTELPPEKLVWKKFQIEGERASFNEIIERYTIKTGKKVDVTYRSTAELEEAIKENPGDMKSVLLLMFTRGNGAVGNKEEVANAEFAGWNPKSVIDVLSP
ncbi:NAD-P-binding protein [Dentipellis sp. KUC8613]|nr:NAD-P-binding protein [Dentipellis sp. KUC8613]